jgi:hypothetical protein
VTRAEFEVLNVIVLKKMCRAGTVSEVLAIPQAAVEETVASLERGDLIGRADDLLLPTGAAEPALVSFTAEAYGELRSDPESDGLYERFERINAHCSKRWRSGSRSTSEVTGWRTITPTATTTTRSSRRRQGSSSG